MMTDGLFSEIEPGSTSEHAVRQIERLLLDGVLSSGDRLPGERDLSERLDISRPVLRAALKVLEDRQLIVSRHGGGTYVADLVGQIFSPAVTDLIARHEHATRDYLEYRRLLEGEAAELAARRATPSDRERLAAILSDMETAHAAGDLASEAQSDIDLHNAIGEAAHNIILMHTLRACYRLLSLGIIRHRQLIFDHADARERLLGQHRDIVDAIAKGDPPRARAAAEHHIDHVAAMAAEAGQASERERVARLRNLQNQTRKQGLKTGPREGQDKE